MRTRARRLVVLRGDASETAARAEAMIGSENSDTAVAWISDTATTRIHDAIQIRSHELVRRLGNAFDVVVLDAHAGVDADLLGQVHGLIQGGGALILRLPPIGAAWPNLARLAAYPYPTAAVGRRFVDHIDQVLAQSAIPTPDTLEPGDRTTTGTAEQAAVVSGLLRVWSRGEASRSVIIADRGRGKSSALGLALARANNDSNDNLEQWITAGSELATAEVRRFAGPSPRFVPLL